MLAVRRRPLDGSDDKRADMRAIGGRHPIGVDGFHFYVMPVMQGLTLRQRMETSGALPVEEAVRIVSEVADALDDAHRNDIIHRDFKPENNLLHDGHAVVADFGIGKAMIAAAATRAARRNS